jgi:hypothetical protein
VQNHPALANGIPDKKEPLKYHRVTPGANSDELVFCK